MKNTAINNLKTQLSIITKVETAKRMINLYYKESVSLVDDYNYFSFQLNTVGNYSMQPNYKIHREIDVVEEAIIRYLDEFCRQSSEPCKVFNFERKKVRRIYDVCYLRNDNPLGYIGGEHLVRIVIRKLDVSKTSFVVEELGYLSEGEERIFAFGNAKAEDIDKMLAIRLEIREQALTFLFDGLKNDGILEGNKDSDVKPVNTTSYVDLGRLAELQAINTPKFDLSKLIRLCTELNYCYADGHYFASTMLVRAIIDHIPPVFGFTSFNQVIAQYGTRSFKDHMEHLDKSLRKIADSHLHTQVRSQESKPNSTQVNFSADLDVLLGEVIRVLKKP